MLIGIDTTCFCDSFDNGKEQVLLNLLKGFHSITVDEEIAIICYESRFDNYREFLPKANYYIVKDGFQLGDTKILPKKILKRINSFLKGRQRFWELKNIFSSCILMLSYLAVNVLLISK